MNFQRLRGQNLLRHKIIEGIVSNHDVILVSDSIRFYELIYISFLSQGKFMCHSLEIYSISYGAFISEYSARWRIINKNPIMVFKTLIGMVRGLIKVYLMRRVIFKNKLLIVSSVMRMIYLRNEGLNMKIQVIRNKPIYNKSESRNIEIRENIILLIGSVYGNRSDFITVNEYAMSMNYKIHCYGLTKSDEEWIKFSNFKNVICFETVDYTLIPGLLTRAKFALCLYPNETVNYRLSASSKIFEILYYGAVPIVSNNEGLNAELIEIGASYVVVQDLKKVNINGLSNYQLYGSEVCTFDSEISKNNLVSIN